MSFCLPKFAADKFIEKLKDGSIDPAKLSEMSSEERRGFFKDIVGEADAQHVNALFESKLLLKNQQAGMINWAKGVTGIKETVRRDIITRIEKLGEVLNPESEQKFLSDLASSRLGVDVTMEEAQQVFNLSQNLQAAKENMTSSPEARLKYGEEKVKLLNYINDVKLESAKTTLKEEVQALKDNPVGATVSKVSDLAGFAKGIKSSLDNSALFRQGWKTLFTNPKIWADNALQSFYDIAKQMGTNVHDNAIIDGIKADIFSRDNMMNGKYQKMKLDIGTGEEAYPTALPERLPVLGRMYKASQVAYEGFLMRMRADIADKYIKIAEENGVDMSGAAELKSAGLLINSLTGRGNLGSFEKVGKQVNTIFFSPKNVKSSFDFLTLHSADKMTVYARKQAATNLLKVAAGMAVILETANVLHPGSVEADPRSSDFGKIRIGDTRFDVSGGMASMVVIASKLATLSSKSATTDKITPLNSGKFGSQTAFDALVDFGTNKLSPLFAVIVETWLKGEDRNGNKPTLTGEAMNLFAPLPVQNINEMMNNPNSAPILIAEIADALGIATNTYSPRKK